MTNKVKPFYIRITDDMTPQIVQDAFDKCHNLGVRASNNDDIENLFDWFYFGVCAKDGTYLSESEHGYFDAQEITLDQLDEWLGIEKEAEWKNGDECVVTNEHSYGIIQEYKDLLGEVSTIVSLFHTTNGTKMASVQHSSGDCVCWRLDMLSKPETPEQKAERERLEVIKEMCETIGESLYKGAFESVSALYDAGYRKQ